MIHFIKIKKPLLITAIIILSLVILYLLLWLLSIKKYPVEFGISFSKEHAESLELDWRAAYIAMLADLKPKYIRLSANWDKIESSQGTFDFSDLDWMMGQAERREIKVLLVIGQKTPRWPECHVPEWIYDVYTGENKAGSYILNFDYELENYVKNVVEHYKDHPALEMWQVENEPFIKFRFGECEGFDENRTYNEVAIVKELDPEHPVLITDSGELSTWRKASKVGDLLGVTLYRVIRTPRGKLFTYDWLPGAVYKLKAKFWGKQFDSFFISELQAEPWFTDSNPLNTPLDIQGQTMNPNRLQKQLNLASKVGAKRAYLWGVEWWYWMKETKENSLYWDLVRDEFSK